MIKKAFLNRLSNRNSSTILRNPVSYLNARSIGILTTYESTDINWKVVSNLEGEGKNTRVISFINNPVKGEEYPPHTFTSKDISITGSFLSSDLLYFTKQKYDFLLCLDITGNKFVKYVLSKTQASHKIGLYHPKYENLLDMMIKSTTDYPIEELLKYAKMIRHD